jgi:hypothetical protein
MKYIVDIDQTICRTSYGDYPYSQPWPDRIAKINALYDQGHEIHYWTSRGGISGIDWTEFTVKQLESWGCKYTTIKTGKPVYDIWIDDKAIEAINYFHTV